MNTITCKTRFQQLIGLMFRRTPTVAVLEFPEPISISIHTWFMFYPIDVYFYNSNDELIETKKNLRPFSYYKSNNKAKYILEVPV